MIFNLFTNQNIFNLNDILTYISVGPVCDLVQNTTFEHCFEHCCSALVVGVLGELPAAGGGLRPSESRCAAACSLSSLSSAQLVCLCAGVLLPAQLVCCVLVCCVFVCLCVGCVVVCCVLVHAQLHPLMDMRALMG